MARQPLYLARQTYRRRRMMDAARLLPVLGAVLVLMPLFWTSDGVLETGWAKLYLFGVWLGLIVAAFALARILGRDEDEPPPGPR